jgi:hypothetical protein
VVVEHTLDAADRACTLCGKELCEWKEQDEECAEIDVVQRSFVLKKGYQLPAGRVAPASCLTGALTDPDVRDSRIRLFGSRVCCSGMHDAWPRERVTIQQLLHPIPVHPCALRARIQPSLPRAPDPVAKAIEGFVVSDNAEVRKVTS